MACRLCDSDSLEPVLALGRTPLADALLRPEELSGPEPTFPLELSFCSKCGLSQIAETVPPELLFCRDYPYYSSFSDALLRHARDNAERLIEARGLNEKSLVVELASNDGYLLRNFVAHGVPVLGIDPAEGPARAAREKGVPTLGRFFGRELAQELRAEGRQADVIIASNVLAHVPDLHGFVEGIRILLKPGGVAVIEAPYVKDLIDRCEFDTIYHEHLCYFSVSALNFLFRRHSLFANHVEHLPIHGGSLRLFAEPHENVDCSVTHSLREEAARGVDRLGYYLEFAAKVRQIRRELRTLLVKLKRQGKRIAAYGAAAKGATLINYVDIGQELIDFVVDRNVHKHGLYMPGKHLPIHAPEKLLQERPEYTLLLTWNFSDEILQQQEPYRQLGGRFIIPIPHPCVV
ncbi:MAG TPA: class I SAM-dependent methyltransferase [Terriglobia bacterium]|nr:class I SAM-dependent methyltransferase [Terriglobia bacterium]